VIDIATCGHVYVAVVISGKLGASALANAAGAPAGGVDAKAMAGGMSQCKATRTELRRRAAGRPLAPTLV